MTLILTEPFVKRMKELQDKENNPALKLRITVDGGGCQGFEYKLELTDQYDDAQDRLFEKNGVCVVTDPVSLPYLEGSEVDFENSLIGAQFKIKNPNAASSCGCGTSFSVKN